MIIKLNGIEVWQGVITSYSSNKLRSNLIKWGQAKAFTALTGQSWKECPTHNGLIVEQDGQLWCGDSVFPRSKLTPFSEYESRLAKGEICNLQLFAVQEVSTTRQEMAAQWWIKNVLPTTYDWVAYFHLTFEALFGSWIPGEPGMRSKFYCTEGIEDAYDEGAGYQLYGGESPNTYSTIKQWKRNKLKLL